MEFHSSFHLSFIFFFIHDSKISGGTLVLRWENGESATSLAALSALTFPSMPVWAGTQITVIELFLWVASA